MSTRNLSFPKSCRLIQRGQFERVKEKGRAQRGDFLIFSALRVENEGRFRAGFVTSRWVGSSVVRNRVRRRLREIVRKHQHKIGDGTWIITVARAAAGRATYGELEDEWLRLAERASILTS
jgi:ribonuclease P protein component